MRPDAQTYSKSLLTPALIASTMVLLLVLQFFWLRSAYNKSYDDLAKETNLIFRSTVFALRDSVIQQNIETLPVDTAAHKLFRFRTTDSLTDLPLPDTSVVHFRRYTEATNIQVLVSPPENDTSAQDVKPLVSRIFHNRGPGNYLLRLGQDSIRIDTIAHHYKNALAEAGIDLPFQVFRLKRGERHTERKGEMVSEFVRLNPFNRYVVSISGVGGRVIADIVPQFLFSLFLTLLTAVSFYVLYRSLLTQRRMAELKNDFISNVTHELKTPITTVGVALEALRNFKGLENPELTREYLDIAQNELDRLTLLTEKVLRTSLFDLPVQSETIDFEKLVGQVLVSMKLQFERSDAKVEFNKEGTDFNVRGNADNFFHVIQNLLDNALKYSPESPVIVVALKDQGDSILFSVLDHGQGIAPEYHKKVFEKFFRVPTGDVHNIKGYGLGLSFVAQVVGRYAGTVSLKSGVGKGSSFEIRIPKNGKN